MEKTLIIVHTEADEDLLYNIIRNTDLIREFGVIYNHASINATVACRFFDKIIYDDRLTKLKERHLNRIYPDTTKVYPAQWSQIYNLLV
jgi:hypothetical protein